MIPAPCNLTLYRGDTFRRKVWFHAVNPDGTKGARLPIAGVPKAQIRLAESAPEILAEIECELLDQDEFPGGIQLTMAHTVTGALPKEKMRWDLQLTHEDASVRTYLAGTVSALGEVTL